MGNEKIKYQGKEVCISTDFDNGHLAGISEKRKNIFDILPYQEDEYGDNYMRLKPLNAPERDWDGTNMAFHFMVDGCKNKKLTFRLHVEEKGTKTSIPVIYANPDFPVYSYDGKNWKRMENKSVSRDPDRKNWQVVKINQLFKKDKVYIAYMYPYTNTHLADYITTVQDSPFCEIEVGGYSTEGRIIPLISITNPKIPVKKKKSVWFIAIQHCAEQAAGWGVEGMMDFLLSDDPAAAKARDQYVFKMIPIVNVDAMSEGKGRIHYSGKNLNREWEKSNSIKEVATIKATMERWTKTGNAIDIFVDVHGFSGRLKEDKVFNNWVIVSLPDDVYKDYPGYERFLGTLKKHIPISSVLVNPSAGFASGYAGRKHKALSLAVDGWLFPIRKEMPGPKKATHHPSFSSHYKDGTQVWSLKSLKAAGKEFIKALVEFGE